jgi:hypothetical protein
LSPPGQMSPTAPSGSGKGGPKSPTGTGGSASAPAPPPALAANVGREETQEEIIRNFVAALDQGIVVIKHDRKGRSRLR